MSAFQKTLEARIEHLAAISASDDYLVRPSLTPAMKAANELVGEWMRHAGMVVREDNLGTLIGRYEGLHPGARTLMIGSHLDTVIDAGRYDGTLGVLLGLAAVEALAQQGRRMPYAIEVVAFADEEGLRFHLPYLGSKAVAGVLTPQDMLHADANGVTIAQAITAYGGNPVAVPDDARRPEDLLGYLEVHIEQGPLLESLGLPIGIVSAISGMFRAQITFIGEAGHAGTVPMTLRRDALAAAAEFVTATRAIALATPELVATVGQLSVSPGASNAIPGRAALSLDLRHQDETVREQSYLALRQQAEEIAAAHRVRLEWEQIAASASVPCSPRMISVLKKAADARGVQPYVLASGAGHDAVQMARLTDVAMMFVRCRGGISHNPAEYCESADAEVALGVLLEALERLSA